MAGLLVLGWLTLTPGSPAVAGGMLDPSTILQQSPAAVRAVLGQPVRTSAVAPGDFQLPAGGTSRTYDGRGVRIDIDFEAEQSTTAVIAFPDAALAPRTYEAALEAVNLPARPRADLVRRDSRGWHNLDGYFVRVIAAYPALDRIDAIILSVHPLP
ncbi:MAG TPA: hypothetical protein VLK28_09300 [Methylomirabilota bacterium]|nr:hypothetical protein [Methylomirabilota bacterium]